MLQRTTNIAYSYFDEVSPQLRTKFSFYMERAWFAQHNNDTILPNATPNHAPRSTTKHLFTFRKSKMNHLKDMQRHIKRPIRKKSIQTKKIQKEYLVQWKIQDKNDPLFFFQKGFMRSVTYWNAVDKIPLFRRNTFEPAFCHNVANASAYYNRLLLRCLHYSRMRQLSCIRNASRKKDVQDT